MPDDEKPGALMPLPNPPFAPAPGPGAGDLPVNRGLSCNRTSKSDPEGPRDGCTDTVAGMLSFGSDFEFADVEKESSAAGPKRSTSYPARTNRPSGGTKESSPGRSFHLLSLTQGWKTGNETAPWMPPGQPSCNSRSGTPDTLAVKAIVPFAIADSGRPDGESVTSNVSTISTYISFDVCLTFALRHGIVELAGAGLVGPKLGLDLEPNEKGVAEGVSELGVELGSPTPPSRLFMKLGASTTSRSAFGSVHAIMPPSTISLNSCATTS